MYKKLVLTVNSVSFPNLYDWYISSSDITNYSWIFVRNQNRLSLVLCCNPVLLYKLMLYVKSNLPEYSHYDSNMIRITILKLWVIFFVFSGTIAEGAPIIPISAQLKYNIDVICEYIIKKIPVPLRDFTSEPRLIGRLFIKGYIEV